MDAGEFAAAVDCAVRDLDLLEESLCDLVVALGGAADAPQGSHYRQRQLGSGAAGFHGKAGTQRLRHFRKTFGKLELPAAAFLRVLHLHLRRGAALLKSCPAYLDADASTQADARASGSATRSDRPIVTSLKNVSGLPRESLLDIVEGRNVPIEAALLERLPDNGRFASHDVELFCRCYVDAVMDLYEGVLKRVCTFDIYDCMRLRCFFVNLEHVLVGNGVRHVRVRNEIYSILLRLMRFALKDAWWIRADVEWLSTRLPFALDQDSKRSPAEARLEELRDALNRVIMVSGHHGALDVRRFDDVARVFGLSHEENDMWRHIMGSDVDTRDNEYVMFKKVVVEVEHEWVDVVMAALVTVANAVLFECFVRQVDAAAAPDTVAAAASRLEMLSMLVELLHETDFAYTAWAVDLLGPRADSRLLRAFRLHGELLLKGDGTMTGAPLKRLDWGQGILVYVGALRHINVVFHKSVTQLVDKIAAPTLEVIAAGGRRKLWWELLYSQDKLLVGPQGVVGEALRGCNKRVRDAVCVELFARIIAAFGRQVARRSFDSEQTVFNALAIWDSFGNLNLGSSEMQNSNYHINKLFEMLEKIKMGAPVNVEESSECLRDFWEPLLTTGVTVRDRHPTIHLANYVQRDLEGSVEVENRVWVSGVLRKRSALFGSILFLFTDDSSLQPVGMVDLTDVTGVYSLRDCGQRSYDLLFPESDAELYSCGTTDSDVERGVGWEANFDNSLLHWGWCLRLKIGGSDGTASDGPVDSVSARTQAVDLEFMGPEHRERWLRPLRAIIQPLLGYRSHIWWPKHSIFLEGSPQLAFTV
ncbi:cysteine proteinase [Babesia caballi]|uniref:Cysteine proteinase n=1 Tax=Babesia caballi TaxID=5871 RepID=A0AAV4LPT1_BABCB|nr:cysteine proteinase [Babesia caballi]